MPLRVRLATRSVLKCRKCQDIIAKPEPKASSSLFVTRNIALDHLPTIVDVQSWNGDDVEISINYENPTRKGMHVGLSVESSDVVILSKSTSALPCMDKFDVKLRVANGVANNKYTLKHKILKDGSSIEFDTFIVLEIKKI